MRRRARLVLLIAALAPGTWLRTEAAAPSAAAHLSYVPVALPPADVLAPRLGAFRLEGAWRMTSPDQTFGNFSALVIRGDGLATAFGDRGLMMDFALPDRPWREPAIRPIPSGAREPQRIADAEAATRDPEDGGIWVAWENTNAITRLDAPLRQARRVKPAQMRWWPLNQGPESMVRLADGRFIVIAEEDAGGFGPPEHPALLFQRDPVKQPRAMPFRFAGPSGFLPTDMVQLADGRVLVLMRKLVWPIPLRFAGRIVLADPRSIRPDRPWQGKVLARLSSWMPVDNFEAMALEPGQDGRMTLWLLSDDNHASTQATVLWKLSFDPRRLR